MGNNRFDFNKQYSAKEIADIFELPIFVERKGWSDSAFKYQIISVADTVVGEAWKEDRLFPYNKVYTKDDKFLICKGQEIKFRKRENTLAPFPVVVMATMSSGKSTLINALLDKSILPSSNSACTAKSYRIFDNDNDDITEIEPIYKNKSSGFTSNKDWALLLKEANEDPNVEKIIIKTQIKGILNTRRRLVLVDTPGTNNSQDENHGKITLDILSKIDKGLIVYIINATQFGINDDKLLLIKVSESLKSKKDLSAVFVVNKCDEYEEDKGESLDKIIEDVRNYLVSECGVENPDIMLTSALLADIFKKALRHENLTRKECRIFKQYFELNPPSRTDLSSYAILNGGYNPCEYIEVSGEKYKVSDIISAINGTGIPYLERYIQKAQIESDRI